VIFPATLPLAGAAFAAMLQLSLVCERWPLAGIGRIKSGIAALVLSWAIGAGAYFLLASLGHLPAPQRAAAGLHNPGGPVATPDFGAALIAVGVWQAVFFIALHGWPVSTITRPLRPGRPGTEPRPGRVRRQRALDQGNPNDWITTAALSFAGAGIILHTGIGLRWPFTPKTTMSEKKLELAGLRQVVLPR
jgi:hypothetical protein